MVNNRKKKYQILIIEDNEINCEILNEILQEQYALLFAYNGQEGMAMLSEHYNDIDVVLLDIQMPVMNGYEVLEAKGQEVLLKDIPVIVTTSSNGGDEEVRCLELGAQDFVRKPYDPIVVRLRIESIINLRESNKANRQKTLFIQSISHEIRTPMNAIMGFAQLMESMMGCMSDEDMRMFCNSINTSSHALLDMINNMVTLSELDGGYTPKHLTDLSPNKVCKEAICKASYCTPEGVSVSFTSDVDDSYTICSDEKYLNQAIYNYIINANKFSTRKVESEKQEQANNGEIHIHCTDKAKPDTLTISVTDTGIGVEKEKSEEIFRRFTKIDSFIPGMGLGLAITRSIANVLNGSAYLDTSYDTGSRFVLEVPVTKK